MMGAWRLDEGARRPRGPGDGDDLALMPLLDFLAHTRSAERTP
jgi:hypothetical protein